MSGGPRPAEQLALRFDAADLAIEVLPQSKRLRGTATLRFTARAPLTRLLIDLDRNLPVSAVSVNGVALKPGAWSNPDGRLAITLPAPLAADHALSVRIERTQQCNLLGQFYQQRHPGGILRDVQHCESASRLHLADSVERELYNISDHRLDP